MFNIRSMRLGVIVAVFACGACAHEKGTIQGLYSEPGGATLRLAADRYQFCTKVCTEGAMQVRPVDARSGHITLMGVPVMGFFRERQAPNGQVRTWGEGVETNYSLGRFGGASIEIDASKNLYFKRR